MKSPAIPAWMRSGRPDTICKNCLNVQEGIVEACDFDPAMCEACETTACKWHPSKRTGGRDLEEDAEEEDAEADEAAEQEDAGEEDTGDDADDSSADDRA